MSTETVQRAAEHLPGRVLSALMDRPLMGTRSWPSSLAAPRTNVPNSIVKFVREFLPRMGVEYDAEMKKRLQVLTFCLQKC